LLEKERFGPAQICDHAFEELTLEGVEGSGARRNRC
jgi:hypothetical protein